MLRKNFSRSLKKVMKEIICIWISTRKRCMCKGPVAGRCLGSGKIRYTPGLVRVKEKDMKVER